MTASALWSLAKAGVAVPFGPIQVRLSLRKSLRLSPNPHRGLRGYLRRALGASPDPERRRALGPWDAPLATPERRGAVAVVVGAGLGFGASLARRFAQAGMRVVLVARTTERLTPLLDELRELGGEGYLFACDAADQRSVRDLFEYVERALGPADLVVCNLEHHCPGAVIEVEASAFEESWRVNCLGPFLVGQQAARSMLGRGSGTIVFTGITASVRGNSGYLNMAVGKFGVRALAQCMARELGPRGIHVVHTVLDSGILSESSGDRHKESMTAMHPNQLAETYFHLYAQHPSAWTHEIDLRPWAEPF